MSEALDPMVDVYLPPQASSAIQSMVGSITPQCGRAVTALLFMQACIKTIDNRQSIRLHKGSGSQASFSWREGISMRSLDKDFVTPFLRSNKLLRLNADGFMMTRSLAENYPYTSLYKAKLRGARREWLSLVDDLESGEVVPKAVALTLLRKLQERSQAFDALVRTAEESLAEALGKGVDLPETLDLFQDLIGQTR